MTRSLKTHLDVVVTPNASDYFSEIRELLIRVGIPFSIAEKDLDAVKDFKHLGVHDGRDSVPIDFSGLRIPVGGDRKENPPDGDEVERRINADPSETWSVSEDRALPVGILEHVGWLLQDLPRLSEEEAVRRVRVDRPLVDLYARRLRMTLLAHFPEARAWTRSRWPDGAPFAMALTHDIDIVSHGTLHNVWRRLQDAVSRPWPFRSRVKSLAHASLEGLACLRRNLKMPRTENVASLTPWFSREERHGVNATYFFTVPHNRTVDDPFYTACTKVEFQSCSVPLSDVLAQLAVNGAELGVHGNLGNNGDETTLRAERSWFEEMSRTTVRGIRQHHLDMDYPLTQYRQQLAGYRYDSSVGFNRYVGFRAGTGLPWKLAQHSGDGEIEFYELPLVCHDVALFRVQPLGLEEVKRRISTCMDEVERVGGVFCVNWHNYSRRERRQHERLHVYDWMIQEAQSRGAWMATAGEIVGRWHGHCQSLETTRGGNY